MAKNNRLLIQEQILAAPRPTAKYLRNYDDGLEQLLSVDMEGILEAQDAKTRADTLKEVGEWLTRKVYADGLLIPHSIVESLKKGEMP